MLALTRASCFVHGAATVGRRHALAGMRSASASRGFGDSRCVLAMATTPGSSAPAFDFSAEASRFKRYFTEDPTNATTVSLLLVKAIYI
jgi:hypothetical protein